ncbi:unnamed protein product [Effrenium voratum]|nr:unnamed protein product [Effrenium voratum]
MCSNQSPMQAIQHLGSCKPQHAPWVFASSVQESTLQRKHGPFQSWAFPVSCCFFAHARSRLNTRLCTGKMGSSESKLGEDSGTNLAGELFLYDETYGYAAFEALERGNGCKALVCIGGLTDGLLSLRYMPPLAKAAHSLGWRTIQPVLQSSYRGWGFASLAEDAVDLDRLLSFLKSQRGISQVVLLGSSTGCQDAVHFLKAGQQASMVQGIILQAPVSDREALLVETRTSEQEAALAEFQGLAAQMVAEGKGEELMPRAACQIMGPPHVITAYRFDSLTRRMADDDMFSSDLSDLELRQKLGHVSVPALLVSSADDEYIPSFVDKARLCERLGSAMAVGVTEAVQCLVLESGGHGVRSAEGQGQLLQGVEGFLRALDGETLKPLSWELPLAQQLRAKADRCTQRPLMVAIAGVPGSGKSRAAQILERLLGADCLHVPMDGFHLPLAQLQARPDAEAAVYRRGAVDTFDPKALEAKLLEVREGNPEVLLPQFDHAHGDPVPDALRFRADRHRIVLVEGLYLLHDKDGWEDIADVFDFRIFLDANLEECIARVKERNKVIPGYTVEEIEQRCEVVDRANAQVVQASARRADLQVAKQRLEVA